MDPRIGMFCNAQGMFGKGQYYCYPDQSYNAEPFSGSLAECEIALGLEPTQPEEVSNDSGPSAEGDEGMLFTVTLRFQYPAWDDVDGIPYPDIAADSKQEANDIVRRIAMIDGHLGAGKGRCWFSAVQQ